MALRGPLETEGLLSELEHKTFALKALTAEGQFSAIISTDAIDRDGEIVAREAFTGSLAKSIPLIQSHDWGSLPVGRGVIGQNAEGTTLTGSFFLDTQQGAEAYKTAKNMADLQEFSVGFRPLKSEFVLLDGKNVRKITDMELFEASLVLVGAARGTRLMGIKSAEPEEVTIEKALEVIKAATQEQLHAAMADMTELHAASCDMGDDCPMASKEASKDELTLPEIAEREAKIREIEAALGYRPLIAGKA